MSIYPTSHYRNRMPSTDCTRRGLLAVASGYLGAGLAGCFGTDIGGSSSSHRTRTDLGGNYSSTHEYEVRFARAESDDPFVFRDEDAATEFEANGGDDPHHARLDATFFVLDDAAADDLRIETAADELRSFVTATDFDSESILIQQQPIGDCFYREVTGVEARDDDFHVHMCRWLKDPTAPCEADRDVMEAIVLRVARPYGERPSSRGSSESAVCRGAGPGRDTSGNRTSSGNQTSDQGDSR